jgi:hypothetical protein
MYNKTTLTHRRRTVKQCKDRWHKVNKLTDLFECCHVKARRVFTSGYSNDGWRQQMGSIWKTTKITKMLLGPLCLH